MIPTLLLLLWWCLAGVAHAQEAPPWRRWAQHEGTVFHQGDDPAWAAPDLDDSGWRPAELDRAWLLWTEPPTESIGWYRTRVPVTPGAPVGLAIAVVYDAAEVYVDGTLRATLGDPGAEVAGRRTPIAIVVPEADAADGELIVAVRLWGGASRYAGGRHSRVVTTHPEAAAQYAQAGTLYRWERTSGFPKVAVGWALIAMGLFHALLWFRRRDRVQGLFALGATLFGVSLMRYALVLVGVLTPGWWYLHFGSLERAVGYIGLLWFAVLFMDWPRRVPVWIATAGLVATGAVRIAEPPPAVANAAIGGYAPAVVVGVWLLTSALVRGVRGVRPVALGFVPLTIWGIGDVVNNVILPLGPTYTGTVAPWLELITSLSIVGSMSWALIERFADTLDAHERAVVATSRFVPDAFLALLGKSRITEVERGDSAYREITVMFCSVRDLAESSRGWTPQQSFEFINRFLAAMEPCVHDNGGFVAQYLGDGFLALFPVGSAAPVRAAVQMQEAAGRVALEPGQPRLALAIGLHTGPVMLGTIGSEDRLTTAQVSDVVNSAARLKGLSRHYGAPLVMSDTTRVLVDDEGWAIHELDAVVVKGKAAALRAWEVLPGEPDPGLRRYKQEAGPTYGAALAAFRAGDMAAARAAFAELAGRWRAARLFVDRCDWYLAHGVPDDWDGVVRMTVK